MIGKKTYSRQKNSLDAKITHSLSQLHARTPSAPHKANEQNIEEQATKASDPADLLSMGSVNLLSDDINEALESVNPRHSYQKCLLNFQTLRIELSNSREWCRVFRAVDGLQRVFTWWQEDEDVPIHRELLWLVCNLAGQLRRVDHFCSIQWISKVSVMLFTERLKPIGDEDATAIGKWLIGKACFCVHDLSELELVVPYLCKDPDDSALALLDAFIKLNVPTVKAQICKILDWDNLGMGHLKLLVTLSGTDYGWEYVPIEAIDILLSTLKAVEADEWIVFIMSVLINCVDRGPELKTRQFCAVMTSENIRVISQLFTCSVSEVTRPYYALFIAFCQQADICPIQLPPKDLATIRHSLAIFSRHPDMKAANTVRSLAACLVKSGWLPCE